MSSYIIAAVVTAALVTFSLRALPFLIKQRLYGSEFLTYFGKWMPVGAMVVLMIYAISGVDWGSSSTTNWAYGAGIATTTGVHLWRKNIILSIVVGTLVCAVLMSC